MRNPYKRISTRRSASRKPSARRASASSRSSARRVSSNSSRPAARRSVAKRSGVAPRRVRPLRRLTSRRQEAGFDPSGEFNPQRFDYGKVRNAAATNTDRRMFDSHGQINANDKKDALTQAYHLLTNSTKRHAMDMRSARQGETLAAKEARRDVLAAALNDPTGFAIIGQELALPIKDILDYEGFARKIFRVRPLAQGELFRIPLDIRSTAWVLGQDGKSPRSVINTKWVMPDETKITSFPVIDISDIYRMNFDVLDRAQDTARQEIELKEDKRALALMDAASTTINTTTTFATLNVSAFEHVRFQVERHRLMVEQFIISRSELSDVVTNMSANVDPVTERELLLAGYIGNFLNARILTAAGTGVEEVVPAGTFYAATGPDYLGEMGIRIELMSEPFNEYANQRTTKGWAFMEEIGYAIPNSKTVAKGVK